MKSTSRILIRKHEGKNLLGRPRCRWDNNIKMGLTEIGCEGVDWIHLAQHKDHWWAVVNKVGNFLTS
jgi:hypothetical protein